jgi:opacity protein-like surface antigen
MNRLLHHRLPTAAVARGKLALVVAALVLGGSPASAANRSWDPAHNGTGSDGSGNWDTATANWAGSPDFAWSNSANASDVAVFGYSGTAGVAVQPLARAEESSRTVRPRL